MKIDNDLKIPFYAKITISLIGLFALVTMLYIAQSIIIPIVFSVILAIVLHPVVNFFVRYKINRNIAIVLTLLLSFFAITGLGLLLITQVSQFKESWPTLVDKCTILLNQSISWVSTYFDIRPRKIHEWITQARGELINNEAIGATVVSLGNGIVVMLLVPVYIFMILFYKPLLLDFIRQLFGKNNQEQVGKVVNQIKMVIQKYLVGLVIEAVMVAVMNIAVLIIFGIEYAILLGIIGAIVNVIPYIGGLVGVALPMIVALATKTSGWYAVYILIAYYFIQLIDNNYIVPKIVASKVKINALFSIIVVIAGNALWGVSGMFLAIPLLAIVKLIFDQIEPLKPWGYLLGDTMPSIIRIKTIFKKNKIELL